MDIFKDYAKFYNLLYTDKSYKQEAEFVYKWANRPKIILELGIGTGQHAKYWCKKVKIIGIDNSWEMLKQAYKHPNISYIQGNIETFNWKTNDYDCVVALFNVMGYSLLEYCLPKLPVKPKGYFIFDIWNASKFKQYPPIPKVKHFNLGYRIAIPEQISKRLLRIDYIIVEGKKIQVFERHFVQGYFHKDIIDLCKKYRYKIAGMKQTKTWPIWYKLMRI